MERKCNPIARVLCNYVLSGYPTSPNANNSKGKLVSVSKLAHRMESGSQNVG